MLSYTGNGQHVGWFEKVCELAGYSSVRNSLAARNEPTSTAAIPKCAKPARKGTLEASLEWRKNYLPRLKRKTKNVFILK